MAVAIEEVATNLEIEDMNDLIAYGPLHWKLSFESFHKLASKHWEP